VLIREFLESARVAHKKASSFEKIHCSICFDEVVANTQDVIDNHKFDPFFVDALFEVQKDLVVVVQVA